MKKELGFVLVVSLMFLMLSVPVSAWNPFDWFVTTPDDNPTPDEPLENMIPQEEARLKEIENRLIKYIEEGLFNLGAQEGWSDLSEEVKIRLLNKVDIKKALLRAGRPNAFVGGNGRCSSNEDCEPGLFCISGGGIFGFVFLGGEPDLCCNRGQMIKEGKCVLEGEHLINFKSPSDEELQFLLEKLSRTDNAGEAKDSVVIHISGRLAQAVGYTLEEINKIKKEVDKITQETGGGLYLFIPPEPETHKEIPTTPEETSTDEDLSNKNMPSSIEPTTSQEPESQGPSADNFIPVVEESTLEEPQG
ncbi:MAG: hypothetical protein KJ559_03395, partial [Nanoarchaeota archaeon]|nr:hypothetical protein [Nanoarchaeota archaeon]